MNCRTFSQNPRTQGKSHHHKVENNTTYTEVQGITYCFDFWAPDMPYVMLQPQNFSSSSFLMIFRFLLLLAKESMLHRLVQSVFFIGYPENAKYPPDKKNVYLVQVTKLSGKLAFPSVKIMSLNQKHKIVMKVANIVVSKLHISLKNIKSSG